MKRTMKYELRYKERDGIGFHESQKILWDNQRYVREIKNKAIRMLYFWEMERQEHFERTKQNLDVKAKTGYKRYDGYIYNIIKKGYPEINSANLNAAIQDARKKWEAICGRVRAGEMSLPTYGADQPINVCKKNLRFWTEETKAVVELSLFSGAVKKEHGGKQPQFYLQACDKAQRTILERILNGEYGYGESKIIYEKKKWFLLLVYSLENKKLELDLERILGIDLGTVYVICASVKDRKKPFIIKGDKTFAYAKLLEERKRSRQEQARFCGVGRVGHGTKTRLVPVFRDKNRLSNYQKTLNHRYSKAVVDYAVKNGCGTIQMENLFNIKENTGFPKRLQHWTYFDLQNKIEYKAQEQGICVRRINPQYTSQRCSKCGYIDSQNRITQERFSCKRCGFSANADFNASQNISIKGIEEIIKNERGANS